MEKESWKIIAIISTLLLVGSIILWGIVLNLGTEYIANEAECSTICNDIPNSVSFYLEESYCSCGMSDGSIKFIKNLKEGD